ncbi:MAG TPA: glycosyltransferase family 4 protein [Candidatus Nanopelagicaceae bacterium]
MAPILFVTNDFGPRAGGIETFIIGLVERLPKNRVIVFTSKQGDTRTYDEGWLRDFGVRVIRDRSKVLLPTPRVARALNRLARETRAETTCFGAAAPLGLLAPTLRRAGVKRIVCLTHGHEVWWSKVFPFSLAIHRIGNCVDALTYLGEFTHRAIARALPRDAQKAMVKMAPGIDIGHFSPLIDATSLRNELGLIDKAVIVCVGRLVPRKGQDRLIQAMPLIRKTIPNVHLLLVGEGSYRSRLEKMARKAGVQDRVTFIGRVQYQQLPAYIRVGDLFAMPSRSRMAGLEVEGLGIVYLEASACGLPVIAGNSGGAPDAVIEGKTGFVIDGTQVESIANAAILILANPNLAKSMGIAGRDWVVREWSWDLWAGEFAKLLKA